GFVRGNSASITISVINGTFSQVIGPVTVVVTLPSSLTLSSISGSGWQCAPTTCVRSDAVNSGASYPPITLIVSAPLSAPGLVTVQTNLTAGNLLPTVVSTVFSIPPLAPTLLSPANGALDIGEVPNLSWSAGVGATSYDITFGTSSPPPLQ